MPTKSNSQGGSQTSYINCEAQGRMKRWEPSFKKQEESTIKDTKTFFSLLHGLFLSTCQGVGGFIIIVCNLMSF